MHVKQIIKNINIKNINIKKSSTWIGICIIVLIIFLGGFWFKKKNTYIEGNFIDIMADQDKGFLDNISNKDSSFYDIKDETEGTGRYTFGGINFNLSKDFRNYSDRPPERVVRDNSMWKDLEYDTGELADNLNLYTSRDISNLELEIINDNCSGKSLLKSDFKDDICTKYIGDYSTINEKCRQLTENTCPIVNCCVLLNGNKCVAGDKNGPTFYTNKGDDIEFQYYEHRGRRYPEYNPAEELANKCGKYANNSTGVSKDCMIQLFNKAGCSNPMPDKIITDKYVEDNIRSTKRWLGQDLSRKVRQLKMLPADPLLAKDNVITCNGTATECDNYYSFDKNISSECMKNTFESERLNQLASYYNISAPNVISDVSLNTIKSFITDDNVDLMQNQTKIDVFKWIKEGVSAAIAPLFTCNKYDDNDTNVSEECIKAFIDYDMQQNKTYYNYPPNDTFFDASWNEFKTKYNIYNSLSKQFASFTKKRVLNLLPSIFRMYVTMLKNNKNLCKGTIDPETGFETNLSRQCIQMFYNYIIFINLFIFGSESENIKNNRVFMEKNIKFVVDNEYISSVMSKQAYEIWFDIDVKIKKEMKDYLKRVINK